MEGLLREVIGDDLEVVAFRLLVSLGLLLDAADTSEEEEVEGILVLEADLVPLDWSEDGFGGGGGRDDDLEEEDSAVVALLEEIFGELEAGESGLLWLFLRPPLVMFGRVGEEEVLESTLTPLLVVEAVTPLLTLETTLD